MTIKNAIIKWVSPKDGGRGTPPVSIGQPPYAAVIRIPPDSEPWPPLEAWRVVVRKVKELGEISVWLAEVRYLVEDAPHHLLVDGTEFELYEGKKCVARGKIVKE